MIKLSKTFVMMKNIRRGREKGVKKMHFFDKKILIVKKKYFFDA